MGSYTMTTIIKTIMVIIRQMGTVSVTRVYGGTTMQGVCYTIIIRGSIHVSVIMICFLFPGITAGRPVHAVGYIVPSSISRVVIITRECVLRTGTGATVTTGRGETTT